MTHRIHTDFEFDNNYNIKNGFTRVKFGNNKKITETELNEMQKIQEETRSSLIRQIVPTGFTYLKRADIKGDKIICNPNNQDNTIVLAPSKMFMNGYEIAIEGDDKFLDDGTEKEGYLKIELPNPPSALYNEHFLFLEFWFEELSQDSTIRKHGYSEGEILANTIKDHRINAETSRRVGLKWRVRVIEDQNFSKWSEGFGYESDLEYSPIYAQGPKNSKIENVDLVFRNATDSVFKDCDFYGDNNLWVGGRPWANGEHDLNSTNNILGIVENYVFAVPLMRVRRRNSSPYSISNPNGASQWIDENSVSTHPNNLFYNKIIMDDIIDLRKSVSFDGWNTNILAEKSLKDLVTGNLQTNKKEIMHRAQFGTQLVQSNSPNVFFIARFNGKADSEDGLLPTIKGDNTLKYGLGSVGEGLILNGESSLEYDLPTFNKIRGGIDFFFRPFWGSSDIENSQTIFTINDTIYNTEVFEFKKIGTMLSFKYKRNNSGLAGDEYTTNIDLLNNPIYPNKLHHFRITWEYGTSTTTTTGGDANGSLIIYLNGKMVAGNSFVGTDLNPSLLKIGKIENYNSISSESIIDEVVLYDDLIAGFTQISNDYAEGLATMYPSFNGVMNSFNDNDYEQQDFVKRVTTVNGSNNLKIKAFHKALISSRTPIVYNDNGEVINGTWSNLGTEESTFTVATQFSGENLYIQYNILIPAGNGSFELPTKILKAELNNKEVSFNLIGSEPREISLREQNKVFRAFDYNTSRNENECFARLLYYEINGNGQDRYYIPHNLFGYEVIGIKYVGKKYDNIKKMTGDPTKKFEIELSEALLVGQKIDVQILLGGLVFDYQTHTKSIISNTLKTTNMTVTAPGNTETFTIKLNTDSGYNTIIAANSILKNIYDVNGNVTGQVDKFVVYKNGLQVEPLSITGFGTPFLTITFDSTPLAGEIIEIPVLTNYSVGQNEVVSIWFKHVPYQGMMSNKSYSLKRVSDWIPFVTTLSSGKLVLNNPPLKSINNAFNRLPGGGSFTHMLEGEEIIFKNDSFSSYEGKSANKHFVINKNFRTMTTIDDFDSSYFDLDNEFTVKKIQKDFQDGLLDVPFNLHGFFLQDTDTAIKKYAGSACLVSDEQGNILLFVFGHTHKFESITSTTCKPVNGDLFKLKGNPSILNKTQK